MFSTDKSKNEKKRKEKKDYVYLRSFAGSVCYQDGRVNASQSMFHADFMVCSLDKGVNISARSLLFPLFLTSTSYLYSCFLCREGQISLCHLCKLLTVGVRTTYAGKKYNLMKQDLSKTLLTTSRKGSGC